MGKKKKTDAGTQGPAKTGSEVFCFFCDKEFEDEGVLVQHQLNKHMRCTEKQCGHGKSGKCDSLHGLMTHYRKVHVVDLARVPNSIEGRHDLQLNMQVYGTRNVPEDVLAGWKMRSATEVLHVAAAPILGTIEAPLPDMVPVSGELPTSAPSTSGADGMAAWTLPTMPALPGAAQSEGGGVSDLQQQLKDWMESQKAKEAEEQRIAQKEEEEKRIAAQAVQEQMLAQQREIDQRMASLPQNDGQRPPMDGDGSFAPMQSWAPVPGMPQSNSQDFSRPPPGGSAPQQPGFQGFSQGSNFRPRPAPDFVTYDDFESLGRPQVDPAAANAIAEAAANARIASNASTMTAPAAPFFADSQLPPGGTQGGNRSRSRGRQQQQQQQPEWGHGTRQAGGQGGGRDSRRSPPREAYRAPEPRRQSPPRQAPADNSFESRTIQITGGVVGSRLWLKKEMERFGRVEVCHTGNRQNPIHEPPWVRFEKMFSVEVALNAINSGQVILDGGEIRAEMKKGGRPQQAPTKSKDQKGGGKGKRPQRGDLEVSSRDLARADNRGGGADNRRGRSRSRSRSRGRGRSRSRSRSRSRGRGRR